VGWGAVRWAWRVGLGGAGGGCCGIVGIFLTLHRVHVCTGITLFDETLKKCAKYVNNKWKLMFQQHVQYAPMGLLQHRKHTREQH
jgi:hypothetical protein